jgi:hypothetical protein
LTARGGRAHIRFVICLTILLLRSMGLAPGASDDDAAGAVLVLLLLALVGLGAGYFITGRSLI